MAKFQLFHAPMSRLPRRNLSLLGLDAPKAHSNSHCLKAAALETISELYDGEHWLHIYTDGSSIPQATGAGFFSSLFEGCAPVGSNASNYDGEIAAVYQAAQRLLQANCSRRKVVFFVDSQAAILALSESTPTDCEFTMTCRELLSSMLSGGWDIVLQWVPSHVGVYGNERADELAKQGTSLPQPNNPVSLTSARSTIESAVETYTRDILSRGCAGKRWEGLVREQRVSRDLPRAEAVAKFRLITGHDYLQAHLHRIGLVDSDVCPLCGSGSMVGPHLEQCGALADSEERNIVHLYWEARRRMAEMPRAGIG